MSLLNKIWGSVAYLFVVMSLWAQDNTSFSGTVVEQTANNEKESIVGANLHWANTNIGTVTDENGHFTLTFPPKPATLVVSFVGYQNDSIAYDQVGDGMEILLRNGVNLKEVVITVRDRGSYVSTLQPIKTEMITTAELRKAACCNLSESFETSASVEVSYSDAVSGAKEIRMLGLDGVYAQLTTENIPNLRGLGGTFGLTYIPGSWIESIQVGKGSGSVLNGYESITGQINVEYKKPFRCPQEKLHLNLYANHWGRMEGNINWTNKINHRWSTTTFGQVTNFNRSLDDNNDGFRDAPRVQTYTAKNRWHYQGEKFESQFGVQGLVEKRTGGQLTYNPDEPRTTANGYGIGIDTRRLEGFAKLGIFFPQEYRSLGNMVSATYHEQDMFFGLKNYSGNQKSLYYSSIYQTILWNSLDHELRIGISYQYDRYHEVYQDSLYQRLESVPGVFAEYTYKYKEKVTAVGGLRADLHNLYGFFVTPRLHLRYQSSPNTTWRMSAGRGLHVANIFAENTGIFASARQLQILEPLQPEVAWNYGISWYQKFHLRERDGSLSIDIYRTDFQNQVVVDMYSTNNLIQFYNLKGRSFANAFQVEWQYEVLKNWGIKLAYKFDDVRSTFGDRLLNIPFNTRHKALFNTNYMTPNERWRFDATLQYYGSKFLVNEQLDGTTISDNQILSPNYVQVLGQVTFALPKWEWYIGSENLNNFTQQNLIVAADNPFGNNFDATNLWGPIMGRMLYVGMRFTLKGKEE